jgi:hypothetical protein
MLLWVALASNISVKRTQTRYAVAPLTSGVGDHDLPQYSVRIDASHRNMFAIKAEVRDSGAETFEFSEQKTMYGGKHIAKGDVIFVFASKNEGGPGLIAAGIVTSAAATPRKVGVSRQTPRVSITVKRTALAKHRLGRSELRIFSNWNDGRPETELNFKFYRQATDKIAGISAEAAAFLCGLL